MSEAPFPRVHATQVSQHSAAPRAERMGVTVGLQMSSSAKTLEVTTAVPQIGVSRQKGMP
eukprot:8583489-Lingulodinium_polyedra.AAC.1